MVLAPPLGVVALVVTYHPEVEILSRLIAAAKPQVDRVMVIDNGSGPAFQKWVETESGAIGLFFPENRGIAAAQNAGIKAARDAGATHVVLFDQDSVPPPGMIAKLAVALNKLEEAGEKVAAVGPRFLDARQNNPPCFVRTEGLRLKRIDAGPEEIVPVDYVIASGSLIPLAVLERVGLMDEALFIDYVDIEWGLRAKKAGYRSFGVAGAEMAHSLGDEPVRFGQRMIPLHSPLRHYYLFRNRVALYNRPYLPLNWKLVDAYKLLRNFIFYASFAKPRALHIQRMLTGVWDGLRGRLGPFSEG